jgi:hypothetical protein
MSSAKQHPKESLQVARSTSPLSSFYRTLRTQSTDVGPSNQLASELARALEDNRLLLSRIEEMQRKLKSENSGELPFDKMYQLLRDERVVIPAALNSGKVEESSLLELAVHNASSLAAGVTNRAAAGGVEAFLMQAVASPLVSYGLAQHDKVPSGALWQRLKLSKEGVKFLTAVRARMSDAQATLSVSTTPQKSVVKKTASSEGASPNASGGPVKPSGSAKSLSSRKKKK